MKQDSPLFMLKALPWLVLGWIAAFMTVMLIPNFPGKAVAVGLLVLLAAPSVLLLGIVALARWLLMRVQQSPHWQRRNLEHGAWQTALHIVAWVVMTLVGGAVIFMNLMALICLDNFRSGNTLHLFILSATWANLVAATMSAVFLTERNGYSYILLLLLACLLGLTFWLWSLPGARGLIH